jgi:hypothetical protein
MQSPIKSRRPEDAELSRKREELAELQVRLADLELQLLTLRLELAEFEALYHATIVIEPESQEKVSCFHERSDENIPAIASGRLQKRFHSPEQRCRTESEQETRAYLRIRVDAHRATADSIEFRREFC